MTHDISDLFTTETIKGIEVLRPRVGAKPFLVHEPGLAHFSTCDSRISRIEDGVLYYRGNQIAELAHEKFEVVSEALVFAEDAADRGRIHPSQHFYVSPAIAAVLALDKGPVQSLAAVIALLDPETEGMTGRAEIAAFLIGQIAATVVACNLRRTGREWKFTAGGHGSIAAEIVAALGGCEPAAELVRICDLVLVLHADHEQNCSTTVVRAVASSKASLGSALASGVEAFSGPLHGGASDAAFLQLLEISRSGEPAAAFVARRLASRQRLFGLGHRVYRDWDPRARIMRDELASQLLDKDEPIARAAIELADACGQSEYFQARQICPNPDLFNGVMFSQIGLESELNTAFLCVSRCAGWIAQYFEHIDAGYPISRPRQLPE